MPAGGVGGSSAGVAGGVGGLSAGVGGLSAGVAGGVIGSGSVAGRSLGGACLVGSASFALMPLATVLVNGVRLTLFFDSGTSRTYVSRKASKRGKLKVLHNSGNVSFNSFGGLSQSAPDRVVTCEIRSRHGRSPVSCQLQEVPKICLPLSRPEVPVGILDRFRHLDLAYDFDNAQGEVEIDILIGQDFYWHFMLDGVFRGGLENFAAQESVFGWVLSGGHSSELGGLSLLNMVDVPHSVVSSFWDLESLGIEDADASVDPVLEQFKKTVRFDEMANRYEVQLPWKGDIVKDLCDNRKVALLRLQRLQRKLAQDRQLGQAYDSVLDELESRGFVEKVDESKDSAGPVHYLPHRPELNPGSITTPIRPVFDASCKGFNGISLNDCLEVGPNLLPVIADVLVRFRRWLYAICGDIRKAFLMIKLHEGSQDVHRFLRFVNGEVCAYRFVRVTFGISSSMFLPAAVIRHHLSRYPPSRVVEALQDDLYVDDFLSGADSGSETKTLQTEATEVMAGGGFLMGKWESSLLLEDKVSPDHKKTLGLSWSPRSDSFSFRGVDIDVPVTVTKRVVLSLLARVFDPLGLVLPVTVSARFLFQDIWVLGLGWDDVVPADLAQAFLRWLSGLQVLKSLSVSRRFFDLPWQDVKGSVVLHVFGDASPRGYGACAYLVYPEERASALVRAAGRVAPVKEVSLPCKELLGAVVVVKLLSAVISALKLPDSVRHVCWSDSCIALGWVRGDPSRWKPWVSNRVRKIQAVVDKSCWRYIPTDDNPSDLVTRGVSAEALISSELWWKGPQAMYDCDASDFMPEQIEVGKISQDIAAELKAVRTALVAEVQAAPKMFCFERWSTFSRSLRVIGFVLRFVRNLRCSREKRVLELTLTVQEVREERVAFAKILQLQYFAVELQLLAAGKSLPKSSKLSRLSPYLDEVGLLRVRGRLQESELDFDAKHPVILPNCVGSCSVVRFAHFFLNHGGVDAMITFVRNSYYVFGLRCMAKSVKRSCFPCQKVDAKASNQLASFLPADRVVRAPVFSVVGMDFAGPVYASDFPGKKLYICLFVCGVVRAVHLELVESLNAPDFVLTFRRFSALRRIPSEAYVD